MIVKVQRWYLEEFYNIPAEIIENMTCSLKKASCDHAIVIDNKGRLAEVYKRPPWMRWIVMDGAYEVGFGDINDD